MIDLGGGTLDLATAGGVDITAAGSGELLTASVAHVLGISAGAAEWVKRGPAVRVDAPSQVSDETGARHFRAPSCPAGRRRVARPRRAPAANCRSAAR